MFLAAVIRFRPPPDVTVSRDGGGRYLIHRGGPDTIVVPHYRTNGDTVIVTSPAYPLSEFMRAMEGMGYQPVGGTRGIPGFAGARFI